MKIIVNGINGRMGNELNTLIAQGLYGSQLVAGVDINSNSSDIYKSLSDYKGEADCVIDFSSHLATKDLLNYCVARKLPVVIATTGHTQEERDLIEKSAEKIPVFFSANMSLGVALLASLARTVARTMVGANIEIVEKHHNRKVDVPSGTALLIANEIREELQDYELLVGRSENGKRPEKEIGIHSLRLGNIVGEHEVIVATDSQVITLKHEAQSRALFAEGALNAAHFICAKQPGLYNMKDIVK